MQSGKSAVARNTLEHRTAELVLESEVEPLVALISCSFQVVELLLIRHGVPFCVARLVAPDVIGLCEEVHKDVAS